MLLGRWTPGKLTDDNVEKLGLWGKAWALGKSVGLGTLWRCESCTETLHQNVREQFYGIFIQILFETIITKFKQLLQN